MADAPPMAAAVASLPDAVDAQHTKQYAAVDAATAAPCAANGEQAPQAASGSAGVSASDVLETKEAATDVPDARKATAEPEALAAPAGQPAGVSDVQGDEAVQEQPTQEAVEPVKVERGVTESAQREEAGAAAQPAGNGAAVAAQPSDEAVTARLRQLLAEVDLASTTEKQLRRKLEGEYGMDLSGRKALLRAEINAYLEAQEDDAGEQHEVEEAGEEEEEEEEARGRKRKSRGGSSLGSYLSPEMQEFLGVERLARTQVVKKLWEYIKEHNLQDPKDKRYILFDDKLSTLFTGTRCHMFKLQKLLSKHCKTSDVVGGSDEDDEGGEDGEEEGDEEEEEAPKKAKSSSSSRKRSKPAGGGDSERKPGGFTKECKLSDELAAWIGKPTASRPEITKFFWAYVKERELQDPSDKSFIVADETLRALTGEERFKGFSHAKLLKEHVQGYA